MFRDDYEPRDSRPHRIAVLLEPCRFCGKLGVRSNELAAYNGHEDCFALLSLKLHGNNRPTFGKYLSTGNRRVTVGA